MSTLLMPLAWQLVRKSPNLASASFALSGAAWPFPRLPSPPPVYSECGRYASCLADQTRSSHFCQGATMRIAYLALPIVATISLVGFVPADTDSADIFSEPASCSYAPSGTVDILPGSVQTFVPESGNCAGVTVTIAPDDGIAGFSSGSECTLTSVQPGSPAYLFKVRGCDEGAVTVTVSAGSSVLQTIAVNVGPL